MGHDGTFDVIVPCKLHTMMTWVEIEFTRMMLGDRMLSGNSLSYQEIKKWIDIHYLEKSYDILLLPDKLSWSNAMLNRLVVRSNGKTRWNTT